MPEMVEESYGGAGASEDALYADGYDLFYNPQSVIVNGEEWTTPEQKRYNQKAIAARLAHVLINSKDVKVQWTVHGNGCQVLETALRSIPSNINLSNHQVSIWDPEGKLDVLLALVNGRGMGLHKKVAQYAKTNAFTFSKLSNKYFRSRKVAKQVTAIRGREAGGEFSETSMQEALEYAFEMGNEGIGDFAADFIMEGAMKVTPLKYLKSAGKARDIAAAMVGVTDSRWNAQLHPTMDPAQMAKHRRDATGVTNPVLAQVSAEVQSFVAIVKALFAKLK